MWLIDFIPTALIHLLTFIGIIGTIATLLGGLLPLIPVQYKVLSQVIAVALLVTCIYLEGGMSEKAKWEQRLAEQQVRIAQLEAESGKVTIQEIIKYVDRIKVVKEKGDVIIKEVPIYITQEADNNCIINTGFVRLHNYAARNEVPEGPRPTDEEASGVVLSGVARTVAKNYQICHENAAQLESLQSWIKEQEKLHDK